MTGLVLLARALALSAAASARPALALLAAQLFALLVLHATGAALPPEVAWTGSPAAVGFAAALVAAEALARRDEDVEELLHELHLDRLLAAASGAAGGVLLVLAAGAARAGAPALVAWLDAHHVPEWLVDDALRTLAAGAGEGAAPGATAEPADLASAGALGGAALGAGTLSLGLAWLRGAVLARAREAGAARLLQRGEGVGVLGLLAVALLAPVLALVLLGLAALGGLLVAAGAGAVAVARDRAARRPCPACGHAARAEALACPACGAALEPARLLG